jgi:hypothetical protein
MAHPLPLSYHWQVPVLFASVGLFVCAGALIRGRPDGWLAVVLILVGLWASFVLLVWLRTRAYLMVDGAVLRTRHRRAISEVRGPEVDAVRQFLTPNGPSYRLRLGRVDGPSRWVTVPTALLAGGHSTLFTWLLTWAPDAELDPASRKTLEQLRVRGLVE